MEICTTNGTVKINFKSLGYRKLANIGKSMQIRKPFVQKKICFPYKFLGKITSRQIIFFPISNFCCYLTQPNIQYCTVLVPRLRDARLAGWVTCYSLCASTQYNAESQKQGSQRFNSFTTTIHLAHLGILFI